MGNNARRKRKRKLRQRQQWIWDEMENELKTSIYGSTYQSDEWSNSTCTLDDLNDALNLCQESIAESNATTCLMQKYPKMPYDVAKKAVQTAKERGNFDVDTWAKTNPKKEKFLLPISMRPEIEKQCDKLMGHNSYLNPHIEFVPFLPFDKGIRILD